MTKMVSFLVVCRIVLDELGYVPFSHAGAELFFEVISSAYEHQGLMVTTNLPFENWTEVLGSEQLTGALLDRLTHRVHIIEANGESYRLKQAKKRTTRQATHAHPGTWKEEYLDIQEGKALSCHECCTIRPAPSALFNRPIQNSGRFVGGQMVEVFEQDFATFVRTSHAVGVSSGTDALRLVLLALGIRGKRVVTVPNSFIATTEAISQAGCIIEFVDAAPDTCLMDPNRLEDFLRRSFDRNPFLDWPAAIVPVHRYGQTAEMDEIVELARRYDLPVVEDAAQAHGATHRGRAAGTLGDADAFSLFPTKNLGACGEAGALTTNDPKIADKVRMLRHHGHEANNLHCREGYNARLDAIQAGFFSVKLKFLAQWNEARRNLARRYDEGISQLVWLDPVRVLSHNVSFRHLYVIRTKDRDSFIAYL